MAAEGIKFTQGLAGSSVCGPTRCVLMTGLHTGHSSFITNGGGEPIKDEDETIAEVLKSQGYATGGFGKWGMGTPTSAGAPEKQGFDTFYGYYHQVHAHTYFPSYLIRNGVQETLPGNTRVGSEPGNAYGNYYSGGTFAQDTIFAEAKKFLTANKDKPFFLYLPWTPPHGFWGIPDDNLFWQKYESKPWNAGQSLPTDARVYAALVEMIDAQVGEILQMLKEYGIDDNTLVVFTGDNGGQDYFHTDLVTNIRTWDRGFFGPNVDPLGSGNNFRGEKREFYEGGLRVPIVMRWPGVISKNTVSDLLWHFTDFLTTYADISGATQTKSHDGISIYPTLAGTKVAGSIQTQHPYLYWKWPTGWQAVRMDNWKLHLLANGNVELYDLSVDITESNNIASQNTNIVNQMTAFATEANTN